MRFDRPNGLGKVIVLFCFLAASGLAQQAPPAQGRNPFEAVQPSAEPAAPPPSPFEAPRPAVEAAKPPVVENVIELVEFRGARRVPQDTLRALIFSKKGDQVDESALQRDFMALWNTGRFDDLRLEIEPGATGQIVRFVVTERPVILTIEYPGAKSVSLSEILDRFKERKVGLSIQSAYDPGKVQRAKVVLQEYLAERGRQFATVDPVLTPVPPTSLKLEFRVNEGPKVKVGDIKFEGNKVYSSRTLIRSMRNLRPIGVPRSILLENMFAKAYDSAKLEQDIEMASMYYKDKGYFAVRAIDRQVDVRNVGGGKFRVPLFYMNRPGKRADITIRMEEGRLYRLNKINYVGVKLFKTQDFISNDIFKMKSGDVFSTAKLRKGMEELNKLYGQFGYIDFVPEPSFSPIPDTDKIDMTLNVDEGSRFYVRRIDFTGNTTTRDKVIRRELYIDEGDVFNTHLWDLSILRLNQLGFFEPLKEKDAADLKRDNRTNTVDITLPLKEKGKNSVGLQGGVSGIAGSFIGFNYSTNNFLGLGETLSLDTQFGDRIRSATLGFTEPYLFDRPISLGFTVYLQRYNYDQGIETSLLSGRNLTAQFNSLGTENLLNYVSNGHGFTVSTSYPLRRTFARVGLTYGFDISNIRVLTTAARTYFDYLNFQQAIAGPNSLSGIRTSKIIPSYTYNTVDHPITPSRGRSLFLSAEIAGGPLGGNTNMIRPTISASYFRAGLMPGHVIGTRLMGSFLTGYGGKMAPPYSRFFMGGENDIRGFENWMVSPLAFVPSSASVGILNADGTARTQRVVDTNGNVSFAPVYQTIPVYQVITPGGDTQVIGNVEYRIPIAGPVTLALFFDAGLNKIIRPSQLTMTENRLSTLNGQFPQAAYGARAIIAPGTQKIRSSTGLEIQVIMPVVNAPFRLYWAYNPTRVSRYIQTPIVADRSIFPNQATFYNAVASYGTPISWFEKKSVFRFSIGRTF